MRAIRVRRFGGPEVLRLETVDDPVPGNGEVLVRIRGAGVNPYDTYMRAGAYAPNNPSLPYTPGSDGAGVVEAIGAGVGDVRPGERVFISDTRSGAYAELALCRRADVHHLPEPVSFAQGAGIYVPYATAYRALYQRAHARPGEVLLVHGASGGVGLAAVQFARAAGMTVLGTAGSDAGLALIGREGAHFAFSHRAPDYQQRILAVTGERGADVILELHAHVNLGQALKMLAPRGRIAVVGSRGDAQITPRDIMIREATVLGVLLWNVPQPQAMEIHAALQAGLSSGALRPIVGLELPLADASQAHRCIAEPGRLGKVVLVP